MRLRNIPRAESVLASSPLVIKHAADYKGIWVSEIFKNQNPLHIEIGMGKGQFLTTLAKQNPEINYLGIERFASVLLRAVERCTPPKAQTEPSAPEKTASQEHDGERAACLLPPRNLRFLCMDAARLEEVFAPYEAARIYLNFSDPWPKAKHAGRRLTSAAYFARYDHILARGGQVEFKTDNRSLFDFSTEILKNSDIWQITACTYDLHHDDAMNAGNILTEYEEKFSSLHHPIYKLIAKRQSDCPPCI